MRCRLLQAVHIVDVFARATAVKRVVSEVSINFEVVLVIARVEVLTE
jgi:hypothetical protein